jgi:hypothetical protein
MVTVGEAEEATLLRTADVEPVLKGDLERDLDGDRPRIGEEDACQPRRRHRGQSFGQHERRFVRQAAEHDMRHHGELSSDRLADIRVVISVASAPPRRDAVDQLAAVRQDDPAALGPDHRQRRRRNLHLAIG